MAPGSCAFDPTKNQLTPNPIPSNRPFFSLALRRAAWRSSIAGSNVRRSSHVTT